jgi:nucleotidyltransferase substrate binding protein (TIGR01987 family)
MTPNLTEFNKAVDALERALCLPKDDITRDASIQRFEFCVELAWKSARKVMGTATSAPKQVIREMAQAGIIDNVEFWLISIDQRNLSSHTYNEVLADQVYAFATEFLIHVKTLRAKLQEL